MPKERKLHELPDAEIVKSGTVRLASGNDAKREKIA